jgi:hypothetical protein
MARAVVIAFLQRHGRACAGHPDAVSEALCFSDRDHRPDAPTAVMAGLDPAIPMLRGAAFRVIGITGTRPMMTRQG